MRKSDGPDSFLFIKNHYYPGKLLHASDFVREQEYGNSKLEFLNRKFHGYGVIEGLQVISEKEGGLCLKAGSAIDGRGRMIVVSQSRKLHREDIEGIPAGEFVLGIHYAERAVEKERSFLEKDEEYRVARIAETFFLKAHTAEELRKLQGFPFPVKLAVEKTLYEDGRIRFSVAVPKLVPSDSIFRISFQFFALAKERVEIKWCGVCKIQGASFLPSGQSMEILEGKETIVSGRHCRDFQLCTEEARRLPIILELEKLEVSLENSGFVRAKNVQLDIETASEYGETVQQYLEAAEGNADETDCAADGREQEDWVPLAWLGQDEAAGAEKLCLRILKDRDVRPMAVRPNMESLLCRLREENGIVDIRWRSLLKQMMQGIAEKHLPVPSGMTPPEPAPFLPKPQKPCFRQGVAVIPIPRRYRRGQVLFSDEISHGFSEKNVFVACGRLREESNYAFWEELKSRHFVINGNEMLFGEDGQSGWYIEKQAVRQDIEAGSFRIAVTLKKGRGSRREREVAVSWLAVAGG